MIKDLFSKIASSKIGTYFTKNQDDTPSQFRGSPGAEISFNQEDSRILNPGNQLIGGEVMQKQGSLANELLSGENTARKLQNMNPNYKSASMSTLSDIFMTRHASQP